jgi:hypothetical protein
MTRIEYDLLRAEMPELRLPHFSHLKEYVVDMLGEISRERLIAGRALVILRADEINEAGFPVYYPLK